MNSRNVTVEKFRNLLIQKGHSIVLKKENPSASDISIIRFSQIPAIKDDYLETLSIFAFAFTLFSFPALRRWEEDYEISFKKVGRDRVYTLRTSQHWTVFFSLWAPYYGKIFYEDHQELGYVKGKEDYDRFAEQILESIIKAY